MAYQQQFDFESLEEKEQRLKEYAHQQAELDKLFGEDSDNYYTYNKYIDGFIDLLPYRLGWGFKNNWYEIRWWFKCKYQKIRYGVSDDEVYCLETSIAKDILPRLKYFKNKNKPGIPVKFLPSNYFDLSEEDSKKADEIGEKEINRIIDEIIFAFEYIVDPDKFVPFPKESLSKRNSKDKNSFNREKTIEEKMAWDEYMQKSKECETRKKNGLLLFAEHSDILWI
ncbi:hypothetical protein EB169_09735 [archaeon]|nr:hypothetical protein [archaeon]